MYAQSVFSHRELQGKHANMIHEMLHGAGLNWAKDLNGRCKNGTWIQQYGHIHSEKIQTYDEVEKLWRP